MTKQHCIHVWPHLWGGYETGDLSFILARKVETYEIGDIIVLREWLADNGYTGRKLRRRVTYVLEGTNWGIGRGYVCLGIKPCSAGR